MTQCTATKMGEFNMLRCSRSENHDGEHLWYATKELSNGSIVPPVRDITEQVNIGVTLTNSATMEMLDDGTVQVRIRGTQHAINLGPAQAGMDALQEAVSQLYGYV